MESQKTTQSPAEKHGLNCAEVIVAASLFGLALYGLYKLVSKDTEPPKSNADCKEAEFIKEIIGKD